MKIFLTILLTTTWVSSAHAATSFWVRVFGCEPKVKTEKKDVVQLSVEVLRAFSKDDESYIIKFEPYPHDVAKMSMAQKSLDQSKDTELVLKGDDGDDPFLFTMQIPKDKTTVAGAQFPAKFVWGDITQELICTVSELPLPDFH